MESEKEVRRLYGPVYFLAKALMLNSLANALLMQRVTPVTKKH
jgi:hypothetical protein